MSPRETITAARTELHALNKQPRMFRVGRDVKHLLHKDVPLMAHEFPKHLLKTMDERQRIVWGRGPVELPKDEAWACAPFMVGMIPAEVDSTLDPLGAVLVSTDGSEMKLSFDSTL